MTDKISAADAAFHDMELLIESGMVKPEAYGKGMVDEYKYYEWTTSDIGLSVDTTRVEALLTPWDFVGKGFRIKT